MFRRVLAEVKRDDFQVAHYSVQQDHVHLIAEAASKDALSSAMRSLTTRFAKRVAQLLGRRKGKVWDHRHHRHDLRTPSEVRNALLYVLQNEKKHGEAPREGRFLDPHSSAAWFDGWQDRGPRDPGEDGSWRPPRPRTWLLERGWRRRGLLRTTDAPKATR
jgi:REP element-mobilizing transposase RayT